MIQNMTPILPKKIHRVYFQNPNPFKSISNWADQSWLTPISPQILINQDAVVILTILQPRSKLIITNDN